MKKLIGLVFCLCALLTVSLSMGAPLSGIKGDIAREIDLKGKLPTNKQRSLVKPIEAFITGTTIEVDFNATLGTMDVSIYDEWGTIVYHQSGNAAAGQQLFIDISSFDPGQYTIEFTNSQGSYLSGDFVI